MKFLKSALWVLLFASVAMAVEEAQNVVIKHRAPSAEGPGADAMDFAFAPEPGTFLFLWSELEIGDKQVQGAPYSAEAVTERIQHLSDGNRIVHKNTATVYRDDRGRTRRDMEINAIGNWISENEAPRMSFINDPVAKVHYVLNHKEQTARKVAAPQEKIIKHPAPPPPPHGSRDEEHDIFTMPLPPPAPGARQEHIIHFLGEKGETKKEDLGNQTIEGIAVHGTRHITTIPAGQIGNELPIQVVSEKWYSPDLKVTVMSHSVDPRFGETTYRLTNIRRSEPDASLFKAPEGYKIQDEPFPGKMIIRKRLVEKAPSPKEH